MNSYVSFMSADGLKASLCLMNKSRIVCVQAALTYAEAQMRIDDPTMTDNVTKSLRNLNILAKILKQKRKDNGYNVCPILAPS